MWKTAFSFGVLAALLACTSTPCQTRLTPAPGNETEEAKKLVDGAHSALRTGRSATEILTDPSCLPAHEWSAISQTDSPVHSIIARDDRDPDRTRDTDDCRRTGSGPGWPTNARALLYVYQTSAKGWYSDRAAHFAAREGDRRHVRLFGYMRTNADGRYELQTIRPGGYPDADLPAHIHVEIEPTQPSGTVVTEIPFDDDHRLTPAWRLRSRGGTVPDRKSSYRCEWHSALVRGVSDALEIHSFEVGMDRLV